MMGTLAADEVGIWEMDLAGVDLDACRAVLTPEEIARSRRLSRPQQRDRQVRAWGQLRWLLGGLLRRSPRALRFSRTAYGKPQLEETRLQFNLSHSGDRLVVAAAWDRPLGVDVERLRPVPRMTALARRCFAPPELEAWQGLPAAARQRAFFRFWTLKEAFVKADGRGLALGVTRCVFTLEPLALRAVPAECGEVGDWQVWDWGRDGAHVALCVRGSAPVRVRFRRLPAAWLSGAQTAAAEGVEDRGGTVETAEGTGNRQESRRGVEIAPYLQE